MKNGLLTYSTKYKLINIGDYIQSLAAKQFFSKIDDHVCRENLNEYVGDDVKIILNGWFTHQPENWPPSRFIHPLFVSFHINSVAQEKLTTNDSIAYFKKHEPIGCRDNNTVNLLNKFGVKAYYTGCLTLTLGEKYKRKNSDGLIYFVDPHFKFSNKMPSIVNYLKILFFNFKAIYEITSSMYGTISLKNLIKASSFYKCYSRMFSDDVLVNAKYIKQEIETLSLDGDGAKFDLAERLLQQYSSAKFVVTSRIHCALPCLGIGTPVLYVEDQQQTETSHCRLSGLRELFHVIKCNGSDLTCEIANEKITSGFSFNNKVNYKVLAENLVKTCNTFIREDVQI